MANVASDKAMQAVTNLQAPDWQAGAAYLREHAPELVPLLDKWEACPLHPAPEEEYFRVLLTGIVAQQLSPAVSTQLMSRLTHYVGRLTPENVLATTEYRLEMAGLSSQKAGYALDFARMVAEGTVDLHALQGMTDSQVVKYLKQVRGLGQWTIEMFLLLTMCRPDVLPADDFLLKKGAQQVFGLEQIPKRGQLGKLTAHWKPWRALATWYIWKETSED